MTVFVNGVHGNRWNAIAVVHTLNAISQKSKQSVVGADPYQSLTVLVNRPHKVIEQAILSREGAERPVFVANQTATFGRNPQGIVTGDGEAKNIVVSKSRSVIPVE